MPSISVAEIAQDLGLNKRTIYRYCSDTFLPCHRVQGKYGQEYVIDRGIYLKWRDENFKGLKKGNISKARRLTKDLSKEAILEHIKVWLDWCRNSKLTGKPLSPRTVELYRYYIGLYMSQLKGIKSIISLEKLRFALGEIPITSHSTRLNTYSAVMSLGKYLCDIGLLQESVRESFKKVRPKRFLPARKTNLKEHELTVLIQSIEEDEKISEYQKLLTKTLVSFLANTGLRSSELCRLIFDDINLNERFITVKLGKNNKNRIVGINTVCHELLLQYIKIRVERFGHCINTVFLGSNGHSYNNQSLAKKFKRLSEKYDMDITPHGLRRSFVTINARKGKPLNHLRIACGHKDISTTQGYCMTTENEVVEDMKEW